MTGEGPTGPPEHAVESSELDTLQIGYNFYYQSPTNCVNNDSGIMFRADELGMGIITMHTLTSWLLHRVKEADFHEQVREMGFATICPDWNLSNKLIDVVLVGICQSSEVEANAATSDAVETRLDIDQLHRRFVD